MAKKPSGYCLQATELAGFKMTEKGGGNHEGRSRHVEERNASKPPKRRRKRFQFTLRSLIVGVFVLGGVLAVSIRFPVLGFVVLATVLGIVVIASCLAALFAEAIFVDWFLSKFNSDEDEKCVETNDSDDE